jgi:hypothetical protein
VRDLSVSAPWCGALFGTDRVIDEDTDPDFHHAVWVVGTETLIGLHQQGTPAPVEAFSEYRVGPDHVSFAVTGRDELEKWAARLDEFEIPTATSRTPPTPARGSPSATLAGSPSSYSRLLHDSISVSPPTWDGPASVGLGAGWLADPSHVTHWPRGLGDPGIAHRAPGVLPGRARDQVREAEATQTAGAGRVAAPRGHRDQRLPDPAHDRSHVGPGTRDAEAALQALTEAVSKALQLVSGLTRSADMAERTGQMPITPGGPASKSL